MQRSSVCELLVQATREPTPARDDALAAALVAQPDWPTVFDLADMHGVLAYVYAVLRDDRWRARVPPSSRALARVRMGAVLLNGIAASRVCEDVLHALAARGVETIVLKGPALAATMYPADTPRPFSDLDLLCRRNQLQAADAALRVLGYRANPQKSTEQDDFHVLYTAGPDSIPIELHCDPLQLGIPAHCASELWRSAERIQLGATPTLMLGLEHHLLQLCVHLHTHGYGRLIWFKDLDLLLRRRGHEVDWQRVHALARAEGAALSVRWTLLFLRDLLATPLPQEALALSWDNPAGALAHRVLWPRRHVLALQGKQRLRSVRFNPHLGPLGMAPSLLVMGRRREKVATLLPGRPADDAAPTTRAISHRMG